MADTMNVVSTSLIKKSSSSPNTGKRSEVDSTVPGVTSTDSTEKVDATKLTQDTEVLACEKCQVTNGRVYQDVDQGSQLQPVQFSKTLATDCRKPTLFSAKCKLSYEHLHEIPTSKLCNSLTESSQINDESSNQSQQSSHSNEQFESSTFVSKESCDERERIKASNQMQSSHNFSPSSKELTSLKAVSPLTKAFKSAFHMQGSLQQPSHVLSTTTASPPVMIPSFSVPCLLSPHPLQQTFILDTPPPLHCRISKSPSLVSPQISLTGTSVGSKLVERSNDVFASTRVLISQPSSGIGATVSYSNVVYAAPTSSDTNSSYSMISDITTPNPGCSKSACGKSSNNNNMTLESMLRGHRRSADQSQGSNLSVRNQSSNTRRVQLKQALLPGSLQQPMQQQQEAQSSLQCPRMIHCSNCGHKIDLKTYMQNQRKTGNSNIITPAHDSIPMKPNVTTAGMTVFDLEAICDTGCINQNLPIPTSKKQLAEQGSNTMFCCIDYNRLSNFGKQSRGVTKPQYPHSDELTRSFAPVLNDCVSGCTEESNLAESWGKLDTLDVDEMLQLLEATSELQYCSKQKFNTRETDSKLFGKHQTEDKETTLESVQPANHIVTKDYYDPCYELHSSSGKTSQSGKFGKSISNLVNYSTADGSNESGKSDSGNSDGEVVQYEEEPDRGRVLRSCAKQPTSRICKRRPRKKQMKKTSLNKKKDRQKATA